MSKQLGPFEPVPGFAGVSSARKGELRCVAIQLKSGGLCLYSPVAGIGGVATQSLTEIGDVTHLLAPNHYHNKGLAEYVKAFPDAKLCCTEGAKPRLIKQTGLAFEVLSPTTLPLPDEVRLIATKGLKTGEFWVEVVAPDACLWIVTDAFSGPKGEQDFAGTQPDLLGTFPKFGIGDRQVYATWLRGAIQAARPTALLPCHGAAVAGETLADDLLRLSHDLA